MAFQLRSGHPTSHCLIAGVNLRKHHLLIKFASGSAFPELFLTSSIIEWRFLVLGLLSTRNRLKQCCLCWKRGKKKKPFKNVLMIWPICAYSSEESSVLTGATKLGV